MENRFFDLSSPRDMLLKAHREFDKLNVDLNIDNIFNFFVTAFHIQDYVKRRNAALEKEIDDLFKEPAFIMCNGLCNRGKHLELFADTDPKKKGKPHPTTRAMRRQSVTGNSSPGNTIPANAGVPRARFFVDDQEVDLRILAASILQKWEDFFTANNIP
jgi:hypothetical protein